jgi:hypothetical protein
VIKWLIDIKYTPQLKIKKMKKIIKLTESDLTRIVKRVINEMEDEDLQTMFERMINEFGEQVKEDSFYGDLTSDDMDSFASIVSDMVNDRVQEENPNLSVSYILYYGGVLEFTVFDNEEEEMVATYRPDF